MTNPVISQASNLDILATWNIYGRISQDFATFNTWAVLKVWKGMHWSWQKYLHWCSFRIPWSDVIPQYCTADVSDRQFEVPNRLVNLQSLKLEMRFVFVEKHELRTDPKQKDIKNATASAAILGLWRHFDKIHAACVICNSDSAFLGLRVLGCRD